VTEESLKMTAIRSSAPIVRRPAAAPVARAAAAAPAAPATAVKPLAQPPQPMQPVQPQSTEWTAGRILKTAGVGAGAFVGGNVATFVVDLFFHFGNNGGTAFPGGIYLAAAGLTAAGAMALYNHFKK
jgi:hypothetical protein